MQPKPASEPTELLKDLNEAMLVGDRDTADKILTSTPDLIHNLSPSCETPLIMAIHAWDPGMVQLCVDHGSDPNQMHECRKDKLRPKIPVLIAAEEYYRQAKNAEEVMGHDKSWHYHHEIYVRVLLALNYNPSKS